MSTSGPESNRDRDPDDDRADVDRRFGEIVAAFGPVENEAPPIPPPSRPGPAAKPAQESHPPPAPDEAHPLVWREGSDPAEDDHFVPAETDPLPAGDLHFWGIVIGLTLGPLLVFLSALFPAVDTLPWGALGMVGTVTGFVLLVLRSPRRRSGDDGSGARV